MNAPKHPDQPIIIDEDGIARFKKNALVDYLLEAGPFDLNHLALIPFSDEDRGQFAQLIGYSVSGFGDLPYADRESVRRAAHDATWERIRAREWGSKQPAQVRVFRHDISQWVEVPENRIAWGPDTGSSTCRAELTCRFEFGTPPGHDHYVPYFVPWADKWAVRISFPETPTPEDIESNRVDFSRWLLGPYYKPGSQQERHPWHEPGKDNPIAYRARQALQGRFPDAIFTYLEAQGAEVWCHGRRGFQEPGCAVKVVGDEARWILGNLPQAEAGP